MITLEEIMFNSLMPWSRQYSDRFIFEELTAELSKTTGYGTGMYFTRLLQMFRNMGMGPLPELKAEWKRFAQTDVGAAPDGLLSMLASYRHPHKKVRFYAGFVAWCAFAELNLLVQDFDEHPDHPYQRHTVRNLCTRLERIISTPNPEMDHNEDDLTIIKLTKLAAIMTYLEIIAKYCRLLYTERLKLTPEAVYDQLVTISMVSKPSALLAQEINRKYRPYFKFSVAAYRDVDIINPTTSAEKAHRPIMKEINAKQKTAHDLTTNKSGTIQHKSIDRERVIEAGEAMSILGCSKSTLARYRKNKKIAFSQPYPGAHCKYLLSDVLEMAKIIKK